MMRKFHSMKDASIFGTAKEFEAYIINSLVENKKKTLKTVNVKSLKSSVITLNTWKNFLKNKQDFILAKWIHFGPYWQGIYLTFNEIFQSSYKCIPFCDHKSKENRSNSCDHWGKKWKSFILIKSPSKFKLKQ